MEQRMTDLEIRYMIMERTIQELNETVCRQELALDRLEGEVRQLREQVRLLLPSLTGPPEDEEPPPHY